MDLLRLSPPTAHRQLEVGLIGRDGMTGIAVVLGNGRSPNETFIQVEGDGVVISADGVASSDGSKPLVWSALFLSFAHSFLNQTSRTALSNGTATLEERRWRSTGYSWPTTA